jgi:hypothetical protein
MKEMRARIKRWYPSQIMPILDPQIQTRKKRWTRTKNLEDGAHELLPRYTFYIHVLASDPRLTPRDFQARIKQQTRKSKNIKG